ncbi:DUF1799 domain-containing protein [Stenotrophomonas sp. HITSZ_GD]|uniref:DUF1799 domain-containing protein n=1 Tax=Stenotrophomonas sp. HITSZ_GD TaxID=3037248 RepID=UPI00240D8107|nr:DUF1799 domain-containing protein [Stenotrophomonas sp. HITSZ_GD]MDG2524649.1 DUF1799 domain-containing protein [Stenotrophomonas sp. HITSZ_GD]
MARAHGGAGKKLIEAVGALYFRVPTAAELEGTGFKPKHYVAPVVDLWPENHRAVDLFRRISNQWRCGAGGPIGLDYGVVFNEMAHAGITGQERDEVMGALAVIEAAALRALAEA